ncbi:hypothetical protein YPPY92_1895, partial [Yersinia pestis PY-92]
MAAVMANKKINPASTQR